MQRALPWFAAAAVAALYAPSLAGGFVHWDDPEWIVGNPVVTGEGGWITIWTSFVHHAYYPLYASALRLLWQLGDGGPWAFHAASVAGFALAAGLWAACLGRLGFAWPGAVVAVALFALHPLRVESVAWASALRDVMSLDLCLLALWSWLQPGRRRHVAVAAFAAAVLCKSMVFALAPLPLLIDRLWWGRPWRSSLVGSAPFAVVGLAGAAVAWVAYRPVSAINAYPAGDLLHSLPVIGAIQLRYLRLQLWPTDLVALPSTPAGAPAGWIALGVFAALAVAAVVAVRRGHPGAGLVLAAYVLPMLPVCGLMPLSFPVADRYTLLPSLALCAALGWAARRSVGVALPVAAVLSVALVASTLPQQARWHDSEALWRHSLAHHPRELAAHQNLAAALGAEGRMDEAAFELQLALGLAAGAEPATTRLTELLLFAELLQYNVPLAQCETWRRDYRRATADGDELAALASQVAAANLARPAEVLLRRAEDLGAAPAPVSLARATYEARAGRWHRALGHAGRGLDTAPAEPQLLALQTLALLNLGGRPAARAAAERLAAQFDGLDVDSVLTGMERGGARSSPP
jgi:protein O-mannosyl-transferase